jgi:hypothetical protein
MFGQRNGKGAAPAASAVPRFSPIGFLPTDGSHDGKPEEGTAEKGRGMAVARERRLDVNHKRMQRQDPMDCLDRCFDAGSGQQE